MKIIFVRHGKSNINTSKLNFLGHLQIKLAQYFLKNEKIDCIFCSPQTRALQSANIINKKINVPLLITDEFDERQVLEKEQEEKFMKEFQENYFNYSFKTTNYQSCKTFIDKVFKKLDEIVQNKENYETVVIVAHNSTFYAINAYINKIPKNNIINFVSCNYGDVIKFHI